MSLHFRVPWSIRWRCFRYGHFPIWPWASDGPCYCENCGKWLGLHWETW